MLRREVKTLMVRALPALIAAAIPAVLGYNHFLGRLRGLGMRMENFGSEFSARADRILFDTRVGGSPIAVEVLRSSDGQRATVVVEVLENPVTRRDRLSRRARPLG